MAVLRAVVQSLKIATIVVLAVVAILGARRFFSTSLARETPPNTGQVVNFTVTKDDDPSTVASRLAKAHLIRSSLLFRLQMRLGNDDLQPGAYQLRRGMSVPDIVALLTKAPATATASTSAAGLAPTPTPTPTPPPAASPAPTAVPTVAMAPTSAPATTGIGALRIQTVDAANNEPVPGACYELRTGGPSYCDSQGIGTILLNDVVAGARTVTQTRAPTGYALAAPVQVQVTPGDTPVLVTIKVQANGAAGATAPALPTPGPGTAPPIVPAGDIPLAPG